MDVSSFSDIAFLLIIFFILVTTLQQLMGLTTDFPSGEKSDQKADEARTVHLAPDRLAFNDDVVTMDELRSRLRELDLPNAEEGKRIIQLDASGGVPYQTYFEVMTVISAAGGLIGIVQEED